MAIKSINWPLQQLLNLPGMQVLSCQEIEGIILRLRVQAQTKQVPCPRCGKLSRKLHQNHWRMVRDLPISGQVVYLEINRRQFKCQQCKKPFSEKMEFIEPQRSYTKRLEREIVEQVLESDIHSVAQRNGLSDDEVQSMLECLGEKILIGKPQEISRIGIDEIALVKGQGNYLGVLVDLETRKPVAILRSRRQEEMRRVLKGWGVEVLNQIKEVSIDLWKPYKTLAEELMPNAAVTADRFHVIKIINEELDHQRKVEKKTVEAHKNKTKNQEELESITNSKYSLLKNEIELNEQQKEKLESVKKQFPKLGIMHEQKEKFRNIFEKIENVGDGICEILDWLPEAAQVFPKSTQTIKRWFGEIVGYFEQGTTNGTVEGINNKLKLIKRAGYGFRNTDNFILRALLCWHFIY